MSGSSEEVIIYTDGGCDPNPGVGGWAAIMQYGDTYKELSGGVPQTTNNRMELTAAVEDLLAQQEQMIKGIKALSEAVQSVGDDTCKARVAKILKRHVQSTYKGAF